MRKTKVVYSGSSKIGEFLGSLEWEEVPQLTAAERKSKILFNVTGGVILSVVSAAGLSYLLAWVSGTIITGLAG